MRLGTSTCNHNQSQTKPYFENSPFLFFPTDIKLLKKAELIDMTAKNVLLADDDTRLKGVECSAENSPSSRPPSKSTELLLVVTHSRFTFK